MGQRIALRANERFSMKRFTGAYYQESIGAYP